MTDAQEYTAKGNAILARATIDGREAVKTEFCMSLPCKELRTVWATQWSWVDDDYLVDPDLLQAHGLGTEQTYFPQASRRPGAK